MTRGKLTSGHRETFCRDATRGPIFFSSVPVQEKQTRVMRDRLALPFGGSAWQDHMQK